ERRRERGFFGRPTLCVFWVFVVAACLAVAIPAIPQFHLLKEIESELADAESEEQRLIEKASQLKAEAEALRNNTRYLDARARDRLHYQADGETIIKLPK
ncbi:MAG: septum formation initiator family protein, partial [Akkermansiaceae bacterium]